MSALVIKAWRADTKPIDKENNYVNIVGRESGLIAWILSLTGIDITTRLLVGIDRIEFSIVSLAGTETRLIPLECVCSSYYGYYKPWKVAVFIVALFMSFGTAIGMGAIGDRPFDSAFTSFMLATGFGAIVALVYYFLNRTLTLGFVEHSGVVNGIEFKRSVIENKDINQEQGASVCVIVQRLIESKHKRTLQGIRP